MKNQKTLGLLLGTTCLATIAMTQVSRPGETPAQDRQPAAAGQQKTDSLMQVQQRFQQAVSTELRADAMKHNVTIDDGSVMISLFGDRGIVAGAPSKSGSSTGLDAQRRAGEPSTTTGTDRNPSGTATQSGPSSSQQTIGVMCFSRTIAPTGSSALPGSTGRAPGDAGSPNTGAGQDPQNRDRNAAGQGAVTTDTPGSDELVAFQVRRSQQGQQVELVDESGRVAMQVPLLGASGGSSLGRSREASAPREDREDATVGGGDPLGDPRAQDPQRPRTSDTTQTDMDKDHGSSDWSVVYASVVHQLCQQHHGKK